MSTKRTDASKLYAAKPYSKSYGEIWADVKDLKGIVTKSVLVARHQERTGKPETACSSSVGVILSPRETSKGDCRGNASAKGHLYFFAKLKRKTDEDGVKEEQRYRFHWRKEILPAKTRKGDAEGTVESKKTAPAVEAPVEVAVDEAPVVDEADTDADADTDEADAKADALEAEATA